jgi:hypothetical protein
MPVRAEKISNKGKRVKARESRQNWGDHAKATKGGLKL